MNEDDKDMREEGASPEQDETTTPNLLAEVQRLFDEHGKDRNKVAEALNQLGIPTPRGKTWNYANLSVYMTKHTPDLLPTKTKGKKKGKKAEATGRKGKRKQKVEEKPTKVEEPRAEEAPKVAPQRVPPPPPSEPDPLQAFVKLPSQRTVFKKVERTHQKGNSYRVHEDLYRLAEEKAVKDAVRTGGNMASLVEILLWAYVGGPKEFIVPLYNEESAGTETVTEESSKKIGKGKGGRPKKTS